ncbi:MAG TPA: lysylphosphatidylglycerol synthase transmembrane domain-containing protein [Gaiellaceae bacterium]
MVLIAVVAASVAALLWFRGPDWGSVAHALAAMSWSWALIAVALNLASALGRGLAWRTVVEQAVPPPHPRLLDVFSAFFVGIFANGVLPGRVGEVARVGVLVRRMQPRTGLWPPLLGSVVAHRLLEIFPAVGLFVWVLAAAKIPHWGHLALLSVLVGACLLLALGAVAARRHEHVPPPAAGRIRIVLARVRQGLGVLRTPGAAMVALGLQTLAWLLQLFAVWVAMRAFHLALPLTAAAAVLALMNVALILPLWPGNVGLQQAAIALPLLAYGVSYAHGFAYGIGLQAIESSVGYAGGMVFLAREGLTLGRLRRTVPPRQAS